MTFRRFSGYVLPVVLLLLAACSSSERVVATIGNESISLEEFENRFAQYNGGRDRAAALPLAEREVFLDLLVRFRLKVLEARAQGLLQDSSIQRELQDYKATIATTYFTEKEIIEPGVRKMYDRRLEEVRASHILFRFEPNFTPDDTLEAYTNAVNVLRMITDTNFDSLAVAYSQDPSVQSNKGDLGYFSGGRMVPEFEDAVYSLKVGQVSPVPVRSPYGYHIIKVTDRQPSKGSVQLSHILKRFSPGFADTAAVRDTVEMIYKLIKGGMDFKEAVERYSDDVGSKAQGGLIGVYDRARLPRTLGDILFSSPVDTLPPPFRQSYGYHLFKIHRFTGVPPFEAVEKELRRQYQSQLYPRDYGNYVHQLKKQYNLHFDIKLMYSITHSLDSTITPATETWSDPIDDALLEKPLFTYADTAFTVQDLIDHITGSEEFKSRFLTVSNTEDMIDRISNTKILEYHASTVSDRHPEFRRLMQEYEDGILLYRIEQDEIWNKVVVTDSLMRDYFDNHRGNFRWPKRVNVAEIAVRVDTLAHALYDSLMAGADFGGLAARYTERDGFKERKGEWGYLPFETNRLTKAAATMATDSIAQPFLASGLWSIITVLGKEDPREKTYEEALPEVRSACQENASKEREAEWLEKLRNKYGAAVNKEMLSEAFRKKNSEGS